MAGETTCSHICSNWWSLYYRMDSWLCQYHFSRLGDCSSFFKEFLLPLWGCPYGPLVEEPLKLAAFLFAIYMVPTKSYKGLLLVAITAGLGFQISEDFSYILSDLPDGFSYTISGILGRTVGAVSSHWLYTSFLAMGLVLIWRSRQKLINSSTVLLVFFMLAVLLWHTLLGIHLFEI